MTSPTVAGIDLMELAGRLSRHTERCLLKSEERVEGAIADLVSLCLYDLADVADGGIVFLTPLGLAVRDALRARSSLIEEERS